MKLEPLAIGRIHYWCQWPSAHTSENSFNKWTKISSLGIDIFDLKMMVKSGLEFFILKFTKLLQSCSCTGQKTLPRKAELARQVSRYL